MKRRTFLKGVAAAGAAAVVPAGAVGTALTACTPRKTAAGGWDFDEVIDRSGTWSIKYGRATGGEIPMWIADMDFRTDPYVSAALRKRLDRDVLGYTSTPGAFVDAIVAWEEKVHGFVAQKEWIGYAPGVITSINQAYLTFTEPGDKIIVQPPVYDHFRLYIERLGRMAVDNPMIFEDGHYRMDLEGLENLMDEKTKALVLCNPHNPCGILWDRETLAKLAEICERHGVIVISDEIHGDLALYGRRHMPFCSVSDAAARVGLIFAGPTKAFNLAGLSGTAFCIIPDKEKREKYLGTLRNAKLDEASIPTIEAVLAAYREDTAWLDSLKRYLEGNIACVERFFADNDLGIKPIRPEASFLVWLDCRALGLSQDELMDTFRNKAKIIPSNGASYGVGGEGFIRLNIGCPASVLEEALTRIGKAF
jgi:cystathionine beta-lyase